MDIPSLSNSLNAMKISNATDVLLLKKTMDITKENANNIFKNLKQMELSINPNLGSNIDTKI